MKKVLSYLLMAATVCGISFAAASCSKDDDNDIVPPVEEPDSGANSSSFGIGYIECSWDGTKVVKTPKVGDISYIDPNNMVDAGYTLMFTKDNSIYYIKGSISAECSFTIEQGVTVSFVLCDGCELKVKHIDVNGGTLRIYGQEKGTGKLTLEGQSMGFPGIGNYREYGSNIEIHGGIINVKGGDGAAGIGSGWNSEGKTVQGAYFNNITIYGGTINATGGSAAAGIGGGVLTGNSGTINIYGGDITAQGGNYFADIDFRCYGDAGIGGGNSHAAASVNIYGGNIKAYGGTDAAGIGAGENAPNGDGKINIYGGTVTAQGADYAAGIGGGDGVRPGPINIYGGTVYAYAGKNGAGIGGGEGGESGDITISGGTVRAYGYCYSNGSDNKGYGAGIGSGQAASVNKIIIKGGDIEAYGGEDGAGIGTGEEYGSDINSGTIEIHGGKVWAEGKGYGAGIGAGEDATFGVLGISGGRVDAHAGSGCGPWSGGIGAYHSEHSSYTDGCHIGWAGWERIYIGKGMRLWTYSPNVGYVETVTNNMHWWDFVHQRPQVAFGECDHPGYTEATCPFCYRATLQLR